MALTNVRLALALFTALICTMCARGVAADGVQYIVGLHSKPRSLVRLILSDHQLLHHMVASHSFHFSLSPLPVFLLFIVAEN
jgi:hypothetical protein